MSIVRYKYQIASLMALTIVAVLGTIVLGRRDQPITARVAATESRGASGEHLEGGDDSPRVTLTDAAMATAQIQLETARSGAPERAAAGLEVPAQVEFDPRRVAVVSPRTDARIERLTVVEGDRVQAGQPVALLNSREFLVAQSDLQQAAQRVARLSGSADAGGAVALVHAARRRLQLLGVADNEAARLERGGEPALFLPLLAPFDGSVVKAHVLAGQANNAGDPVFTIADLSFMDVIAEIPERSLPMVRVGQRATVNVAAFPSRPFVGHVERLRDELNPETRTVRAAIHVANPDGRLRAGMFATVRLAVGGNSSPELSAAGKDGGADALLLIPQSAIVTDGAKRHVFVLVAPRTFERREVETAPLAPAGSSIMGSALVLVRRGLRAGEQVVVRGAFTLKSELAKAGLGEHGH